MSLYGYDEMRWGITFAETDSALSFEDRGRLLIAATEMYLSGEKSRKVKGEEYEGIIHNTKKTYTLGSFGGVGFEATIDTDRGERTLRFLVTERIRANLN